jgi:metallo-beta-lactamase family protein
VIIVGFQSRDSLGRRLIEGAREVRIFGEPVQVKAKIHTLGGFSAHAGQSDLLRWLTPVTHRRPRIFLTHGEDNARSALAAKIRDQFGLDAALPDLNIRLDV